jgi:hypothetical protein
MQCIKEKEKLTVRALRGGFIAKTKEFDRREGGSKV